MYRRSRKNSPSSSLGVDSLMDILTCIVGVMLFVVLFAVMEAQGISFNMFTPISKAPPRESTRMIVVCQEGTVRLMDVSGKLEALLGDATVTYDAVPAIVEAANEKDVTDGFFNYRLDYHEGSDYWTTYRAFVFVIEERHGTAGETAAALEEGRSLYEQALAQFDPQRVWLAFAVDEESLDVFRRARALAVKNGFAVGWDPSFFTFPYRQVLMGGGSTGGSSPSTDLSKPQL